MRIASFNVENFFARAKALNRSSWAAGRPVLEAYATVNALLEKPFYTPADKRRIAASLGTLGLANADAGRFAVLRQIRERLVKRPRSGPMEVVANGRGDWVGWVELTTEPVTEAAVANTAQVIADVDADILGVIEAEDRVVLKHFTDAQLRARQSALYPHVMLIDGNDDRGIDVAIITKRRWPISSMRSHVDDTDSSGVIFGRDCPEYELAGPGRQRLVVMVNHFKSKGYGSQADNDTRRRRQALRVAKIYRRLLASGIDNIAVLGDLNDTPDSAALAPLMTGTTLRDISTHPAFDNGGRPGTFDTCTAANRIDYILLSPRLFKNVEGGGIFRMGMWGGKNGTLWPHYDTLTSPVDAASDHAALFADIAL